MTAKGKRRSIRRGAFRTVNYSLRISKRLLTIHHMLDTEDSGNASRIYVCDAFTRSA
jgi:hypothetical protein